jgi:mono/diheme cytochrome c family protein
MLRESLARGAVVATTLVVLVGVAAFAFLQQRDRTVTAQPAAGPTEGPTEAVNDTLAELIAMGKAVYDELGCAACHSIAGEGSPRYPLDGVGSKLTRDEIRLWIVNPQEIQPGVRKPAYDDLEDEELRGLIAYMESLKEDPGGSRR